MSLTSVASSFTNFAQKKLLLEAVRLELIDRSLGGEDGCAFSIQVREDFSPFRAFFATLREVETLLKSIASRAFLKLISEAPRRCGRRAKTSFRRLNSHESNTRLEADSRAS